MPDPDGNTKAEEETLPQTPLHAYKEGRKEDIKGDADKLESSDDPKDLQQSELEADDEPETPEKH
jgi:hypothetical protein